MKVVVPFPLGCSERVGYCFKSPKQQVRSSCLVLLTGALSSGGPRPVPEPAGQCQRLGDGTAAMAEGKFLGWKVCPTEETIEMLIAW